MSQKYNHTPWPLIALMLMSVTASADDHLYEIELIAFTHSQSNTDNEHWPVYTVPEQPLVGHRLAINPNAPARTGAIAPAVDNDTTTDIALINPPTEFIPLSGDRQQLGKVVSALRHQRLASRVLLHTGWVQPIQPANNSERVVIEGGDPLALPGSEKRVGPNMLDMTRLSARLTGSIAADPWHPPMERTATRFELEGTVAFYQTRYPRLEINLCLAVASNSLQLPLMVARHDLTGTGYEEVCSREIRGLNYAEMIYFDTPKFGVIAQVRRITPQIKSDVKLTTIITDVD